MGTTLATQLVLDALNMALATRRPNGVIHLRESKDWGQLPGGLTQTPIDRLVGWRRKVPRCGLTRTPIDQVVSFPGPVDRPEALWGWGFASPMCQAGKGSTFTVRLPIYGELESRVAPIEPSDLQMEQNA
jgi:hypothetical protein